MDSTEISAIKKQAKKRLPETAVKSLKSGSLKSNEELEVQTSPRDSPTESPTKKDNVKSTAIEKRSKQRGLTSIAEAAAYADDAEDASYSNTGTRHSTGASMETARRSQPHLKISAIALQSCFPFFLRSLRRLLQGHSLSTWKVTTC